MENTLEKVSSSRHYEGTLTKYKFNSSVLGDLDAQFNIFLPPHAADGKVPILVYLAGLTCTEDNGLVCQFVLDPPQLTPVSTVLFCHRPQKGGFMRDAAREGIAILFPDTSPRGAELDDEMTSWDFGVGAGFYLNATSYRWAKHYNMFDHVTKELPEVIEAAGIPVDFSRRSIFGHSMGGHGALTIYLKSLLVGAKEYRSCSAFAPICEPSAVPWGQKAFRGYLTGGVEEGRADYDATALVERVEGTVDILVDYGSADNYLYQLHPEAFLKAARVGGHDESQVQVRCHEGYDHSYYFISTFASDHIHFHTKFLKA